MKKHLIFILVTLLPLVVSAQNKVEIDGIWYNLIHKGKVAEVTTPAGTKYSGSIIIPSSITYEGKVYSVTSIGEEAFYGCSSLENITIPKGVTTIGDLTFYGCSSLTAITLPEGTTSIGESAFCYCSSLTTITIPESVTSIGSSAFWYCSSLTIITIPKMSKLAYIREHTFSNCTNLTSINIPENVISIGSNAFSDCISITSITIPKSVTCIESASFYHCSSLTSITIPEGLGEIGSNAFSHCSSLTSIVLPKSVTSIRGNAFANCPELLDVYCHAESVPGTEDDAFDGSYPKYATLHVPSNAINNYRATSPWSSFGNIVALTKQEMSIDNPEFNNQNSEVIYDLNGRRVEIPEKGGIYIVGGKVTIK